MNNDKGANAPEQDPDKKKLGSASSGGPGSDSKGDTGSDKAEGDKSKQGNVPKRIFEPEPDRPLQPHSFNSRAELLIGSPRVIITAESYKRMSLYIDLARKEVGWLGTVSLLKNGDFFIDEVFLLEQEVTPTETELSVEGQNKLAEELLAKGEQGVEQVNRLRFWGHSHVRMSTGPSGTDESTMLRFGREGFPWAVRGIFNKLGRAEFTIYLYDKGFRIIDAPWVVHAPNKGIILQQPKRFSYGPYSGGGNTPWYGSGSTGSIFSSTPPTPPPFQLPPELVPSAELREEVRVEFAEKVTERVFFWRGKDGSVMDPQQPPTDGQPHDPKNATAGTPDPAPVKPADEKNAPAQSKSWLQFFLDLFKAPDKDQKS